MRKLSAFTEKFKHLTPPDEAVRRAVARVIQEATGIDIEIKHVRIQNTTAHITAGPAARSEIFMRKNTLLDLLEKELGSARVSDIR